MFGRSTLLAFTLFCVSCLQGRPFIPGENVRGDFSQIGELFLENHCVDCHDDETKEADLNLLDLGPVDEINAAVWKSVWSQVAMGEMPPPNKSQPKITERLKFSDWVVQELRKEMKEKGGFKANLDPKKANYLDHDLLFGELPNDIKLKPTSSPSRIWRITPQEHITRLNELINTEPAFNPAKPGVRTRGDFVPTNHGGELKLYFGTDRIIRWEGGTVAYQTAVKSVPVVLSSNRKHGFENYADFYSVNSSEATQILNKAEDILKYMAYGPMSLVEFPEQITDNPKTYDAIKPKEDLRGLPSAIVYNTKVVRPITPVYDLMRQEKFTEDSIRKTITFLFEALTFRPPSEKEVSEYLQIVNESIKKIGREDGAFMGLSSIFLDRDALFRPELAKEGKTDKHGRVMLQDWELGSAVNHALSYIRPDEKLRDAIEEGKMKTRSDVRREVSRMLDDDSIRKPRVLRFFRDFFDYDLSGYICKDQKALASTGTSARDNAYFRAMFDATASTDRLIELILAYDKDVLKELLTTQKVVYSGNDRSLFGRRYTKEEQKNAQEERKRAEELATLKIAEERKILTKEVNKLEAEANANESDKALQKTVASKQKELKALIKKMADKKRKAGSNINVNVEEANFSGKQIFARVSRRSFGNGSMKPERNLSTVPEGQRLGILTHPSWLVSHSDAMDNHAIHRGIWVRERLLGGGIPDVPITVDAQLPDEPGTTLRERMRVTREKYCWSCHEKMDPLGLPFEIYNHAGIYRTTEFEKPVDAKGEIIDSGDPSLDGPVANALEMIDKLAHSERVEQVFVRHAFRFWMGRNETLHDRPVLQAAHKAYRESGGSMKALILSLVTSDAFLFRKQNI
ncbi:MAG: DUF1588 domain-containing protein [Opitutales bacterium]|nr:DUF1588 domain-containing protein [Opitutales bacterium]